MTSPAAPTETEEQAMMAQYGITRAPVYRYHYKTFRYTRLSDAIAQAQRYSTDAG